MLSLRFLIFLGTMLLAAEMGCSKSENIISARAYRTTQPGQEILWSLPPDGVLSVLHEPHYYLEVKGYDGAGQAYFVGPRGQLLYILVLNTDSTDRVMRIDTSGYTDALMRGGDTQGHIKLFLIINGDVRFSDLPKVFDLSDKEPHFLTLTKPAQVPDVGGAKPLNVGTGEWVGLFGLPPVVRQQGKQMAIYFYYPGPVRFVPAGSEKSPSSGDLWRDLSRIGIYENTQLFTVRAQSIQPDGTARQH